MNMPLQNASKSLDAPTSASSSDAGQTGAWQLAQPMLFAPAARSAIAALAVAQQQMVCDRGRVEHQLLAGRVLAGRISERRDDARLVDGDPVLHPVGETFAHDRRIVGEAVDGRAVEPAAVVLERLRQVPVVEGHHRLRPGLEHLVDEAVVEVQALRH